MLTVLYMYIINVCYFCLLSHSYMLLINLHQSDKFLLWDVFFCKKITKMYKNFEIHLVRD